MIAAQGDQLLTHRAVTVHPTVAEEGVLYHPLHLDAARRVAVGVATLGGVAERLDAPLDGLTSRLDGAQLAVVSLRVSFVEV